MKALDSKNDSSSQIKTFEDSSPLEDPFLDLYEFINKFKSKDDKILLSIILPMYNEEQTIGKVLEILPRGKSIEIIVVDDCSPGDCKSIVDDFRQVRPHLKYVLNSLLMR